jgi:hypothetical protein
MSDVVSMMANSPVPMTPASGAMVVLVLLMALRVVRALQREPVGARPTLRGRQRPRRRPNSI